MPVLQDDGRVINDSWAIACYLESAYPDTPSLFDGEAGRAGARFINGWHDRTLQPAMIHMILGDIHDTAIVKADQPNFWETREARFGIRLEKYCDTSDERIAAFRAKLEPVRLAVEEAPNLAGSNPRYSDYTLFGTCKILDICSPLVLIAEDDPIYDRYGRMLELFDGFAASDGAADGQAA